MKYTRICLLVAAILPPLGCADDSEEAEVRRGRVDSGSLTDGVMVSISGSVGTISVPFEVEVPSVSDSDFQDEMDGSVSLLVTSQASGASADIGVGIALEDIGATPGAPGEFTWELNSDRDEATLTFFNETPAGLTLKSDRMYFADFSVGPNDYVETLSAISFEVGVSGG